MVAGEVQIYVAVSCCLCTGKTVDLNSQSSPSPLHFLLLQGLHLYPTSSQGLLESLRFPGKTHRAQHPWYESEQC